MNLRGLKRILLFAGILLFPGNLPAEPIRQHPENPHYFEYGDRPMVLVTSAEHYGAIVNQDFDFKVYLERLHDLGLNHTRVFLGDYVEPPNAFCIVDNTLSPRAGRFITPWMRSGEAGYSLGGNKFDLDRWNPVYFERLHEFFRLAQELDIIVEAVLFFEGPTVEHHPMLPENNINGTPKFEKGEYLTLGNGILDRQEAYCRKMVRELNRYDHLILNVANEPWFNNHEIPGFSSPPSDEVKDWIYRVSQWIVEEEDRLDKKHLISIDYTNEGRLIDQDYLENQFQHITVFNHHYDRDAKSIFLNYPLPLIFSFNETGIMDAFSDEYRIQGWKYMLSGGALYNNLDFTFTVGHEDGSANATFSCGPEGYSGSANPAVKEQLAVLLEFMNSIDFVHMRPNRYVLNLHYGDEQLFPLVDEGRQYAIYFVGSGLPRVALSMPAAEYRAVWIDPETGSLLKEERISLPQPRGSGGENSSYFFVGPEYDTDIVLKIDRLE